MRSDQLFPKPPKRMKQPRKDTLRHVIRCRDAEIFRLKAELSRPGYWRAAIARVRVIFDKLLRIRHDRKT